MADIRVDVELKNGEKYEITKSKIDSLSSLSQSTSDAGSVGFGVLSSSGNLEILDSFFEIKNLIENGEIDNSSISANINVNGNCIQRHISNDSSYNLNEGIFSISLQNALQNYGNIKSSMNYIDSGDTHIEQFDGQSILFDICYHSNRMDIYNNISKIACQIVSSDGTTLYDIIKKIKPDYITIKEGNTLLEQLNGFCEMLQVGLIEDDGGELKMIHQMPFSLRNQKIIEIPKKCQYSEPETDIVVKNKIRGVSLSIPSVAKTTNILKKLEIPDGGYPTFNDFYNDVQHSILWQSDSYENLESIYNDDTYTFENFGDWVIAYKTVQSGWINVTSYTPKGASGPTGIHAIAQTSKTGAGMTDRLKVFSTIDEFKQYITENEASFDYPVFAGFLGNGIFANYWQSYTVIFAFKPKFSGLYYPFQLFYITGSQKDVYGNTHTSIVNKLTINNKTIDYGDTSNQERVLNLNSSGLLTDGTMFDGSKLIDNIADSILYYYRDGIKTMSLTICCHNYYDEDGNLVVDWSKGEVIKVGDVLKVAKNPYDKSILYHKDGTPYFWKVTGREFVFDGEPLVRLELQETIVIDSFDDYKYGIFENGVMSKNWKVLLDEGLIVVNDGVLQKASADLIGSLVIPKSITSIGNSAFEGCSKLTEIKIPDSVTYIGNKAFVNCSGLTNLEIPDSVTYIGYSCFAVCSSLESIKLSKNITEIKYQTFEVCSSLKSVEIPYGVTKIGDNAFYKCSSLTNVIIPDTVTSLGQAVFTYCSALEHIYFPSSLTQIYTASSNTGKYTFYRCLSTLVIYCGSSSQPSGFESGWNYNALAPDTVSSVYLTVKYGYTREQYESAVQ